MRQSNGNKITFSVIGLGGRSSAYLNTLKGEFSGSFQLVALAEPDREKQNRAKKEFGLTNDQIFQTDLELLKEDRLSDVAIIGTQDQLHYRAAKVLLEKGYDLILEKPISSDFNEIKELLKISKNYPNQIVAVCHVLRHSQFFNTLAEIVHSEKLGKVMSISHNENVGYYHFAHSYVRGSWRDEKTSGPVIMTKSCHDMDILLYLLKGQNAISISSMGSLSHFNESNFQPEKMSEFCVDCSLQNTCAYSAVKIYSSDKIKTIVFDLSTEENARKNLGRSNYGRCVYKCDNNVCDHQSTIIEFSGGVTSTFNLSAFTAKVNRSIKIMCEYGEIRGIEKPYLIETTDFRTDETTEVKLDITPGGHGGADPNFVRNFMASYTGGKAFESTLEKSIESHVMALLAEDSRKCGGEKREVKKFMDEILGK